MFVLGSNDYFVPQPKNPFLYLLPPRPPAPSRSPRLPTEDLVKGMLDLGWTDLTNTRATLALAGSPVEFVGVDDPHLRYDRYGLVERARLTGRGADAWASPTRPTSASSTP